MTLKHRRSGREASTAQHLEGGHAHERVFDGAPIAWLLASVDGIILDANAAGERLLGGGRDQLRGRQLGEIADLDPAGTVERLAGLGAGAAETLGGTGRRLDGSIFPASADVSVVEIHGDRRLVIHLRELTEAARTQAELVQAQKMDAIGTLVAGVTHELNNPLAAIIAFSDLIRRDERLPEDLRADADLLVAEAGRTRRIVSNLLDFVRQRPPERHPTSLAALIASVVELESYALQGGRIIIGVDLDPELPAVELDRSRLQLALMNLVQNAVQALDAAGGSGQVTITARRVTDAAPPRVRIAVEDDGPGVPPEHRERLFVASFTTRTQGEGTGLGLPVSLGIVEGHGGRLWHEEPGTGHGARFVIELPVAATGGPAGGLEPRTPAAPTLAAPASAPRPAVTGPHASPPRRVLVLDDEPAIRAFLRRALRLQGIEVLAVGSGREALELARTTRFDAMLCDHRMSGMSGPAVYEALEEEQPDLARRFVFMTGDALNPELQAFAASRQITLLMKPFDLATATAAVQDMLERS